MLNSIRRFFSGIGSLLAPAQTAAKSPRPRSMWLGVDYGTSMSKLVLTDFDSIDGDKSFVVRMPREHREADEYLIPSSVATTDTSFLFGFAAERANDSNCVYRSLKMRFAHPDQCYGAEHELPSGFSALDLATLYVGHLIQIGLRVAEGYAKGFNQEVSLGVTMGAPMAQLDDTHLQRTFVDVAREAFELRKEINLLGPVKQEDAAQALSQVRDTLSGRISDRPRDWVRSEAEAALFWAYQSPDTPEGRYASVDIGAGTASASWFHISAERMGDALVKSRLSFFSASCAPPGCDAIDSQIAKQRGLESFADARGKENRYLRILPDLKMAGINAVMENIGEVLKEASKTAYLKELSESAWRKRCRVFFLGGGSKIDVLKQKLIKQQKHWLTNEPVANPGKPSDLSEQNGDDLRADMSFLLVAYGLARRSGDVPDIASPRDLSPYKAPRKPNAGPQHEDFYTE